MRLAVLFAVPQEMAPLARRLTASAESLSSKLPFPHRAGSLARVPTLLCAGGMGARRAESAARAILDTWRPDLLVLAGVAGALSADLRLADVLVATAVETDSGALEPPVVPPLSGPAVRGTLLSLDRVLVTAADKQAALNTPTPIHPHAHTAVEMETAAA